MTEEKSPKKESAFKENLAAFLKGFYHRSCMPKNHKPCIDCGICKDGSPCPRGVSEKYTPHSKFIIK